MEYRSKLTLFSVPLVHITTGKPENGVWKRGVAKGWIAVGDIAFGILFSCIFVLSLLSTSMLLVMHDNSCFILLNLHPGKDISRALAILDSFSVGLILVKIFISMFNFDCLFQE